MNWLFQKTQFFWVVRQLLLATLACLIFALTLFAREAYVTNLQVASSERGSLAAADPWEKRIEAGLVEKPCTEQAPHFPPDHYQGPLIDAHFHPASIPDANPLGENTDYLQEQLYTSLGVNITIGDFACMLRADGTTPRNVLAFFPVYPNIYRPAIEVVKRTQERYPGLFVPFLNPPDQDVPTADAAKVDTMLSVYPGLFKGYGELGLYGHPETGANDFPPDSPLILEILPVLRKHNVKTAFFHLGVGQKESFERVLRENRDLTFIFHGDQLITRQEDGRQDLSQIEEILADNPNVYYGVDELWGDVFLLNEHGSKEQVLAHFEDYEPLLVEDVATWKGFIERFPDQVMWDTDRGTYLWATDLEVGRALVKYGRRFIAELDPAVQEKYAYKNAERAYAGR